MPNARVRIDPSDKKFTRVSADVNIFSFSCNRERCKSDLVRALNKDNIADSVYGSR